MVKVCHITSVHNSNDIRIFVKECISLALNEYDVYLVAKGDSREENGVRVIGIGKVSSNRIKRMIQDTKRIYQKALELDCAIYHLHDPELLPYGLKLKKQGKKVIFDSHEDVPGQILDKKWIPRPLRIIASNMYRNYETRVVKQLDAVIAATPHIAEKFGGRARKVVVVNNYPKLDDIQYHTSSFSNREPIVCYAGGISELRGEKVMIEAMKDVNGTLIIAGEHEKMEMGGGRCKYIGKVDRIGINKLYGQAIVGLCVLQPIENYYYSQPIKMYEYMAAGLPFICSDFPRWRTIAKESCAGICVDPNDTKLLGKAISEFLSNRDKAQSMGRSGREYVLTHCTWGIEEKSLLSLYDAMRG